MTTFIVKSRADIESGFYPGGSAALISISDVGNTPPTPDDQYTDQLNVFFADADVQVGGVQLITALDAENIHDFAATHVGNGIDYIVVNCEAGMSRSAGCAAALAKIHNDDDMEIINSKPMYNRKVYAEIVNLHFGPFGEE